MSGKRQWAWAAGGGDGRTLHLLDLAAGLIHSTYDRGVPPEEPWRILCFPLQWSANRDHLLLERIELPEMRSLVLFSFGPSLRVRTLFREEGLIASVYELRQTFWAPDGTGLAFLVSPGRRAGPTRLFHVTFDGDSPRETDQAEGAPPTVAVDWDAKPPKLR